MSKGKRLGALVFTVFALATAFVPAALADAGGGPGNNAGQPGNQPPPPPSHHH
jgi:hypothetical protein